MSRPPAPRTAGRGTTAPPAPRSPLAAPRPPLWRPTRGALTRLTRFRRTGATAVGVVDGAPRWVSGLLAGIQGALLSVLVVVMPALAAYVATSADPANSSVGWTRAVGVGGALWLLGHGGALRSGSTAITLVPLGITALAVFTAYASARRSSHRTVSAWLAGIGGYAAVVAAVTVLAGPAGPIGAGAGSLVRLALGAPAVAAVGLGLALVRPRALRVATGRWWARLPHPARAGLAAGVVASGLVLVAAALLTVVWVLSGRAAAGDVIAGLGVDTFGGVLLAVAQLAAAPNLVLWASAYLAGPGFAVGAGTLYAPDQVVPGPLPALPLLGALPTEAGGLLAWAPVVVVLAGAVAGWWLHRRLVPTGPWQSTLACTWAAASAGAVAAVGTWFASGAVGPGRLAVVGGAPLAVGGSVLLATLLGAVLVAVPGDALVRAGLASATRSRWARVRGRSDLDLADAPGA